MNTLLKMTNISKTYFPHKDMPVQALNRLNLEVFEGEMLAIYGVSGSGKSTLLHIIGCLDRLSDGEYFYKDINIQKCSDQRLAQIRNQEIGFVLQDFGLIPYRTAYENILVPILFSKGKSTEKIPKRVNRLLEQLGIQELSKRKVCQMSGGQKQRVAIARALVNEPSLILADEPTGALDSATKLEIYDIFKGLKSSGKTIVIVTHDKEVAEMADRVLHMKDGALIG